MFKVKFTLADNAPSEDIPLETQHHGNLKLQSDGTLQFSYQTSSGTETRFFNTEKKLLHFLQHRTNATIWHIHDSRSSQSYFYYYAWGEYSRYNNSNKLYSDIASGTEAGIFSIKEIDSSRVRYYQQKNGWLKNHFMEIDKVKAIELTATKQQSVQWQTQALATFAFAAAAAPMTTALSESCQLANQLDFPTRSLANVIAFSSLLSLRNINRPSSAFHYATLASALVALPKYAVADGAVGNEFAVNSYTINSQQNPAISSFSDGGFVVTWQSAEQDGSGLGVFGKQFAASGYEVSLPTSGSAGAQGNEFPVNSYTLNGQLSSTVATFTDGGFVIVWHSLNAQDGAGSGIYGKRFGANGAEVTLPTSGTGGAINNEFPVNSYTTGNQNFPATAALPSAGFVIVWRSNIQDGNGLGIFGKRFAANGDEITVPTSGINNAIDNEFLVNSYIISHQDLTTVISLPSGSYVAAWQSFGQDGSDYGIFGKYFAANDTELALATSGMGGAIGNEFRVNDRTSNSQELPAMASLADGGFVVTWQSNNQDGSGLGVYGKRFAADGLEIALSTSGTAGAVGNEFPINTYTTSDQGAPAIASLSDGGFVVTWQSDAQDGSGLGVFAKRFAANGAEVVLPTSGTAGAVGNEFPINTHTSNDQGAPAIASLSDGGFVVTWQSDGQIDNHDLFGKRFAANGTEIPLSDGNIPIDSTETPSEIESPTTPRRTRSSGNDAAIGIGVFVALCCLSGCTTAILAYVFRSKLTALYYDKKCALADIESVNNPITATPMSGQMSYHAPKKSTFESFLQTCDVYADRFYLLTTIIAIVSNEIYEKTGFKFSIPTNIVDTSGIVASGQFGEVFFAFDTQTKQFVLCKMIKGQEACQSSKHEAEVHNLVSNKPGIIRLIRFGDFTQGHETEIRYVHFLEYANFGNGDDLVRRLQQIQDSTIKHKILVEVARQLLVALTSLLDASVYHADLKTSNIVVNLAPTLQSSSDIEVKLIDFGCSQHLPDGQIHQQDIGDVSTFSWPRSNYHKARAHNFPIEPFDAFKEDLWALGLIIFELASGRDPKPIFDAKNAILRNPPAPIPAATFEDNKRKLTELADASTDSIYHLADQLLTVEAKERPDARSMLNCSLFSKPSFRSVDEKEKAIAALKSARQPTTAVEKAQSYYSDGSHAYDRHYSNVGAAGQAMLFAAKPYSNLAATTSIEAPTTSY